MAHVQRCMVHMVRNSCQYISFRDRKDFCNDMKQIYQAHCLDDAGAALDKLVANWDTQYHTAVNIWVKNFDTVVAPLFNYPACIRKVIYTTNAIEIVNSSLRKVVKKGCYSSKESIMSIMLLRADKVLSINWERRAVRNWAQIKSTLSVLPLTEQVMAKYAEAQ